MPFVNKYSILVVFILAFTACKSIKDAPIGKPFVYDHEVKIIDKNIRADERKYFQNNLEDFWHDSLNTNAVRRYLFFTRLNKPPVFDTANISESKIFMNNYMETMSFYNTQFNDSVRIDSSNKNQQKTYVKMFVQTGKPTVIDSFDYAFENPDLQNLAKTNLRNTQIREKKSRLSRNNISNELDRTVSVFRNNGYYFLRKNNLVAEIDTLDPTLMPPFTNIYSQVANAALAAQKRIENPTATVLIKERKNDDSTLVLMSENDFKKYTVGRLNFFPDLTISDIPDSVITSKGKFPNIYTTPKRRRVSIYQYHNKFHRRPILEHTYLMPGSLYNDSMYFKTINNLNSIGAWQNVDAMASVHGDSIDFNFFMVPALQYNTTVDIEASRNSGDYLFSSNLFGLALNLSFKNRNLWRRAIQATSYVRGGVELNFTGSNASSALLQTLQLGAGHTFSFPRFIVPFTNIRIKRFDNVRTVIGFNASYTERREYFRLRSVTANYGYTWQNKRQSWQYRPLNIELYGLDTLRLLDTAFKYNPFLTKAFNTGTVISQQLIWRYTFPNSRIAGTNFLRIGVEEAGALAGLIPAFRKEIYRFIRLESEYIKHYNFRKTTLAMRGFGGIGYNYNTSYRFGLTLPFFKQFIAGGPNSMRGWNLRQLGLGSSLQSDTSSTFRDRYGDMQLEANIEYRFPLFAVGNIKANSAVFADIGNIWNLRKQDDLPNAEFNLSRLGHDIAIAVGTGLRLDFNYFLIRFDLGFKLKDPTRLENNGWLNPLQFTWHNKDFPVRNNPLTGRSMPRNNYSFQLGIGLPF